MESRLYQILEKPLVTEKSAQALAECNRVSFRVRRFANKLQIKEAVEKIFSVTVLDVHTLVVKGKRKRFGRQMGMSKNWKKAIVRLKEGDKIDIFEGV
ncbi:MAG: 50S ribosomal protein L23 [Nitrospinae bacterium]|nr:50S ribosomal protein L23 [Nitrospinota bacterium]